VYSTQVLDSIFAGTGHETITLPPYHCNTTNLEYCENHSSTKKCHSKCPEIENMEKCCFTNKENQS
jgi:hypothetical protein